jgi:hypothetical protein
MSGSIGQLCLMGLGYLRSMVGDTVLEPNEARINPGCRKYPTWGRICPTGATAMALEPDGGRINPTGQICPTWAGCQASRI